VKRTHEWDNPAKLVVVNEQMVTQEMDVYDAAFSVGSSEVASAVPSFVDEESLSTLEMTPLFSSNVSSSPD